LVEKKKHDTKGFSDIMDWETYRKWTRTTAEYPKDREEEYLMIGLANEVGEVLGKYKKHLRGDMMVLQDFREGLIDELGDVMWYFARICDTLDVKMYEVMVRNMNKLTDRLDRDVIKGEGDKR